MQLVTRVKIVSSVFPNCWTPRALGSRISGVVSLVVELQALVWF